MKTVLALTLLIASMSALAAPVGIASGQPTGTNYPMAADIAKVCSTPQSPISNVVSEGSLDNIQKIYGDKNTQYGIVQVDALEYMKGQDPKMIDRIQMVFPFFSTEMHLVAKDGSPIQSLSQLQGKRVVEGPEGSGTWVSVQVIKALTGLKWTPIKASQKDGFDMVINGQADAEFIVAGAPIGMLQKASGFKLVSLQDPKLDSFGLYTKALISSGTYPAVKTSTSTYKVDNVLATYAFKNQYQGEISTLVGCIAQNIGKLQTVQGFHPKWRDVDPTDIDRIKWPAHPAAVAAIRRLSLGKNK
jgi:TRAP transporter TAXI family solute receptor